MNFSIVTICFNDEKRIYKTLESVYKQTYQDYEHIIIDGMSTDDTLKRIERHNEYYKEGQLKVYSEKDEGIYDAMNKGILRAKGDYICFMNVGDCFYNVNVLEEVAKVMNSYNGYDIYYGKAAVVYPNGAYRSHIAYSSKKSLMENISSGVLMPCHQAIFARKECFQNNMFDLEYKLRAEAKWFFQCHMRNMSMKEMECLVCKYEYGGTSDRLEAVKESEKELLDIFKEYGISIEIYDIRQKKKNERELCWTHILNKWLALRISGMTFEQYFKCNNIKKIAIYGYGVLGSLLVSELKNTSIEIRYIVDREKKEEYDYIQVYSLEAELPEVDMMIMTVVNNVESVCNDVRNRWNGKIVLLDDILEEMWYV